MTFAVRAIALAAAFAGACASAATDTVVSDAEIWNRGVSSYRDGDVTNALAVITPLVGRRDAKGNVSRIGRNAAELAAKIRYERAASSEGADALALLEEAAADAQIALRADVERRADKESLARSNRNFTRAVDKLPELRRTRRINSALEKYKNADPGALMAAAALESRKLMDESAGIATNAPAAAISLSDALSGRAKQLAERWIPLRETIVRSVTNEEQAATILAQLDAAQKKSEEAVSLLEDMDSSAYGSLAEAEQDFNRFLKMTALPPLALGEDLVAQSNAWLDVEAFNGRAWQDEALAFTRAFRAKFPAWARAYEQQAQADTNKPPFKAEDQAKVAALASQLEKLQIECSENVLPPKQQEAIDIIIKIRDLLPKDGSGGGQSQANPEANPEANPQPNQSDKNKDRNQNQDQNQDLGQNEDRQDGPSEGEEDKDRQEKESEGADEQTPEDREVQDVLKKAQERSDEHEAEKRARMRKRPLAPNEKDW